MNPTLAATLTLFLLSTAAALAQEPPPAEIADKETLLTLLAKGGPVMIPLAFASVVALTIAVERALSLRADRLVPTGFLDGLKSKGKDSKAALAHCDSNPSPLARMLKPGIKNLPRGAAAVEKAIEDAGAREADRLHRSLRSLSVIAAVSPLLGLLGTVYGLIGAF